MGPRRWLRNRRFVLKHRYSAIRLGSPHTLPAPLVVSLTSYLPRFSTLDLTLRCLLSQSVAPDAVVLWVSPEDRPKLPPRVTRLQKFNLVVREHRDIGPFTKIVPALKAYPDAFILTADDDVAYPRDWAHHLVSAYAGTTDIICRRAHRIRHEGGRLLPYVEWDRDITEEDAGPLISPTGHGGVLYPPGALPPQTTDEAQFTRLCPKADDVWLYWMAARAGRTFRRIGPPHVFRTWPRSQSVALYRTNVGQAENDSQIAAMVAAFGLPPALATAPAEA